MRTIIVFLAFVLTVLAIPASAQIPRLLSYQGVLADSLGVPKPDGIYTFTFRLYQVPSGGSDVWVEIKDLQVKGGLFHTSLGDVTPLGTSIGFDRPYWLGVKAGADPELSPRIPLTPVGSSLFAVKADTSRVAVVALSVVPTGAVTGYYNLLGYEGIGTLGSNLTTSGQTPPVGDYTTTHCRYINVQTTTAGQYYLRYPVRLPQGATITNVRFFVADFNSNGVLWVYLRSRPWNSRAAGTILGFALTDNTTNSDKTINIPGLSVNVDNQTTQYWIDVSPTNGTDPGQLCVYGIQVTYTIGSTL